MTDKNSLRIEMLKKRSLTADKDKKSELIVRSIKQCGEYIACKRLFIYVSLPDEPSTRALIESALADGREVFVPKCENSDGDMTFREIKSFSQLKKGCFSVLEPDSTAFICDETNKNDLCIVPGTAFDFNGNRIGYGKGYYDRFLADFKGFSIGLCFSDCFTAEIAHDENDIALNAVCTEDKLYYIK